MHQALGGRQAEALTVIDWQLHQPKHHKVYICKRSMSTHNSVAVTCRAIVSPPSSSMMSGVAFRDEPLKLYSRGAGVLMSPCEDDNIPARAFPSLFCTLNMPPACVLTWGRGQPSTLHLLLTAVSEFLEHKIWYNDA